jgi:hypothetical protein
MAIVHHNGYGTGARYREGGLGDEAQHGPAPDDPCWKSAYATRLGEMLRAKEAGQPYDEQALQRRLASAVAEAVQKQAENGIDILTDGEQSKTSFTT